MLLQWRRVKRENGYQDGWNICQFKSSSSVVCCSLLNIDLQRRTKGFKWPRKEKIWRPSVIRLDHVKLMAFLSPFHLSLSWTTWYHFFPTRLLSNHLFCVYRCFSCVSVSNDLQCTTLNFRPLGTSLAMCHTHLHLSFTTRCMISQTFVNLRISVFYSNPLTYIKTVISLCT